MSDKVKMLNKDNFDEVISQDKVSLVDFWAEWCGPCKMLLPVIDEVADELGDDLNICKLNVDESGDVAQRFSVMTIPTLIIFKNGEIQEKLVGFKPKAQLMSILTKFR